jgi:uncharacterized membrane protein
LSPTENQPTPGTPNERLAESTRVEAFSDGVFAVAITLLVLDLHTPTGKGDFLQQLLDEWQTYVAYLAAFIIIGVIWLTHHSMFTRVSKVDTRLMLHNLLYLLTTSLVPFAAAVISGSTRDGNNSDRIVAVVFFAIVATAVSLSWLWLLRYLERSPQLLSSPAEVPAIHRSRVLQPLNMLPSLIAVAIAFFSPMAGLVLLTVSPLLYLLSLRDSSRQTSGRL